MLMLGSSVYQQKWTFARVRAQNLTSTLNFSLPSLLPFQGFALSIPPVLPAECPLAARLHAPEAYLPLLIHLKGILPFALRLLHKTSQITGSGGNQGNFRSALLIST